MKISFIVPVDRNWATALMEKTTTNMPADCLYFKSQVEDKPIILGRKTYEAICGPIPGRRNLVLTRDKNYTAQGCEVFTNIDDALHAVQDVAEVFVVGGSDIFRGFLSKTNDFTGYFCGSDYCKQFSANHLSNT